MNRLWLERTLAVVFLVGVGTLAVLLQSPPGVVAKTAPLEGFSSDRAMVHVRAIAGLPHRMGSTEAARVRDYLVRELEDLGLETELLADEEIGTVNVVGVLRGAKPSGKALMLAAHYDSVEAGPGAGDDAAGVGAILETVRALKNGPLPQNDVIALLTDGEEQGLFGAKAFVKLKPWVDRVGLVLNFEGRGNSGPSYMFETSERNGWLIREFAKAAPHPMATSLAYAVYQRMPNSTDLTIFKRAGLKGLNFAFVDGVEHYHQPSDTPENLDERSVQHHGSYALALARHFGSIGLDPADSEPDAIYFHAMGPNLIVYAGSWVGPLAIAACVLFAGVTALALRRGAVSVKGLAMGTALSLVTVLLALGIAGGAWELIKPWRVPVPGKNYRGSPALAWFLGGVGLAAALATMAMALRKVRAADLTLGGLAWWLVFTVAVSAGLPGGSYLFVWPTLFGLAAMAVGVLRPSLATACAYIGSIPALVLLPPTFQTLCTALGPSQPYAASPVSGLIVLATIPLLAVIFPRPLHRSKSSTERDVASVETA